MKVTLVTLVMLAVSGAALAEDPRTMADPGSVKGMGPSSLPTYEQLQQESAREQQTQSILQEQLRLQQQRIELLKRQNCLKYRVDC